MVMSRKLLFFITLGIAFITILLNMLGILSNSELSFTEPLNGKIMFEFVDMNSLAVNEFLLTVDDDVREAIVEKMATGDYHGFFYDRNVPREIYFVSRVTLPKKHEGGIWGFWDAFFPSN